MMLRFGEFYEEPWRICMSETSAAVAHRRAAIIAKGERIQTMTFTDKFRERRNVNREPTASTNPGNQPNIKRTVEVVDIFRMSAPVSEKNPGDSSKFRMSITKDVAMVTQAAKARRKGKALLRCLFIYASP